MQTSRNSKNARSEPAPLVNLDAERFVLGAAMTDRATAGKILDTVSEDFFGLEKHRIIFRAMREIAYVRMAIDHVTLCDRLIADGNLDSVDGVSYVVSLDDGMPRIANIADYISILKEKRLLRRALVIGEGIVAEVQSGTFRPAEIIDGARRALYESIPDDGKAPGLVSLSKFVETYPGGINQLLQPHQRNKGILTGFTRFDELTDGFHDQEVFMLGAYSGTGKTAFLLQIFQNVAERFMAEMADKCVAIFSLEMSRESLFNRLVCREARVPVMRFRRGDLNDAERVRIQEAATRIAELPILIDDASGIMPTDIASRVDRLQDETGLEVALVGIDYVQLMRGKRSYSSPVDRLSEIAEGIQNYAKASKKPVAVLSQLIKQTDKQVIRKPATSDLKYSGTLIDISNVIAFIWREEIFNRKKVELRGKAELLVAKNREGALEDIPMTYTAWNMKFDELSTSGTFDEEEQANLY